MRIDRSAESLERRRNSQSYLSHLFIIHGELRRTDPDRSDLHVVRHVVDRRRPIEFASIHTYPILTETLRPYRFRFTRYTAYLFIVAHRRRPHTINPFTVDAAITGAGISASFPRAAAVVSSSLSSPLLHPLSPFTFQFPVRNPIRMQIPRRTASREHAPTAASRPVLPFPRPRRNGSRESRLHGYAASSKTHFALPGADVKLTLTLVFTLYQLPKHIAYVLTRIARLISADSLARSNRNYRS